VNPVSRFIESVEVAARFRRAIILGIGVAVALAAAYAVVGIQLQGIPSYPVVDAYAFTITTFLAAVLVLGYFLRYRDVSETVAFAAIIAWAVYLGLEDILVYVFLREPVPSRLPWLDSSPVGIVATVLGFDTVTRTALFSVVVGSGVVVGVVVYGLYRFDRYGL